MQSKSCRNEQHHPPVDEHCPTCNGSRSCDVHGHIHIPWEKTYGSASRCGGVEHSLLRCRGCGTVFYLSASWDEDGVYRGYDEFGNFEEEVLLAKHTYPHPDICKRPIWLDAVGRSEIRLQRILEEVYVAQENGAYALAAMGLRTALDVGAEVLGVDPAITYVEKLAQIQEMGWIGGGEREVLDLIAYAGGAAAHRAWAPDPKELEQLLYAVEVFLQRAFLIGRGVLSMKDGIPPKPKRKKTIKEE